MKRAFFQAEQDAMAVSTLPVKTRMAGRQLGQAAIEKFAPPALLSTIYLGMVGPRAEQVHHYALHLAELFDTQIYPIALGSKDPLPRMMKTNDLLIYQEPEQSRFRSWFFGPPACRIVTSCPISVLVARQPRWPLKEILLVTRGRLPDYAAIAWITHLALLVQVDVTVLAVQPHLPVTNYQTRYGEELRTWLTTNAPLGQQLRHLVKTLKTARGELAFQFRDEVTEHQIRQVIIERQPDLIVIGAEPVDWWERRMLADLVTPLLRQSDRPVLVAKSNF